jgi:type II secretory pathway pseudopilin PulG
MRPAARLSNRSGGFSLIEVTLALLVFALAVMAVLAMFPSGAVTNRDAQDFTYSSQFARRVFHGVIAETMGNPTRWNQLTNSALSGCINPLTISTLPQGDFPWDNAATFACVVYTGVQTVAFRSIDNTNVMDHVLRYRLLANLIEVPRSLRHDYCPWLTSSSVLQNANGTVITNLGYVTYWWVEPPRYQNYECRYRERTLRLTLEVWPGYYGQRNLQRYSCYVPRFL